LAAGFATGDAALMAAIAAVTRRPDAALAASGVHCFAAVAATSAADAAYSARTTALAIALTSAATADYYQLLQSNLGTYPELGAPIDPTENGPLGTLWPERSPAG
jgi:hypothetical protein